MPSNHLASETSPYLLQHADNPVDWYPWGSTALELAREQNKPILLSIGYSACHWCHVMAHESFEDQATAELMNQLFINIKVDREERPDLDKVYQLAHSVITRRTGGWPLTVFLTPDLQLPIFAGTYFPINPAHGLPAFKEILARIAQFYHTQAQQLEQHKQALTEFFAGLDKNKQITEKLDQQPLLAAELELENNFDRQHGGFGGAPKFPHPTSLELCLRLSQASVNEKNNSSLLHIFEHSLKHMAQGGIYDHLAGGFFRYCVDANWTIPHFEKMLYDNGPLLGLYATAAAMTGNDYYKSVTRQTADWVIRDMQSAEGAYYATLDADSEGVEGKFYVWTADEINTLLGSDAELFRRCYGLDQTANFEHAWHLQTRINLDDQAHALQMQTDELEVKLSAARVKLLQQRELRIPPARDEKILCSWNALMIKGMVHAYRCSKNSNYLTSAQNALTFIQEKLWQQGRLLAKHNDSNSELPAYLDDYAFLLDALLEILQIRWRSDDLKFAVQLAEILLAQFLDTSSAGFFFTANDHERLIYRSKPYSDDALPSGNGVAAYVLARLGWLLAEPRYLEAAEASIKLASNDMQQAPLAHASMLLALQEQLNPVEIIILRGDKNTGQAWHKHLLQHYQPQRMVYLISKDETDLPDALAKKTSTELACVAYICQGTHCSKPIDNLDELLKNRALPDPSN